MVIAAAQYLRRSTEHQQYSLENQAAKIQEFAERHGFQIIQTYSDGKSGVVLKRRTGLRQLLQDVVGGQATYKAVLVYDVSRWGRFQDTDEPAHYEFLCRSAGVPVHYCAESFVNDGSMPSLIMKALKRSMAGEYSRELSAKVSEGLRRLARMGFKQGGMPGYGFRRMLLSSNGTPKQVLKPGERKSITTDRVVLVPGPEREREVVRSIFRMFVSERRSIRSITRSLNEKRIKRPDGATWKQLTVKNLLTNPKYSGCHVFGRTSSKLCTSTVRVPKESWAAKPGAWEAIVDQATFDAAQKRIASWPCHQSDDQLLQALRRLLARKGNLTSAIINRSGTVPSVGTLARRFQSLARAYDLIGFGRPEHFGLRHESRRRVNAVRDTLMTQLEEMYPGTVSVIGRGTRWRTILQLPGFLVSVRVARAAKSKSGANGWIVDRALREHDNTTLLARLTPDNGQVYDLYLVPALPVKRRQFFTRVSTLQKAIALNDLTQFYELAMRMNDNKNAIT